MLLSFYSQFFFLFLQSRILFPGNSVKQERDIRKWNKKMEISHPSRKSGMKHKIFTGVFTFRKSFPYLSIPLKTGSFHFPGAIREKRDDNCPCSNDGRTVDFPRHMSRASRTERLDYLKDQLRKRVVILDGAHGNQYPKIQAGRGRLPRRTFCGCGTLSQRFKE